MIFRIRHKKTLNNVRQNGTLEGLAELDYHWGKHLFDTSGSTYTESAT